MFDPNQPRDPSGTPTGGQWTSGGDVSSVLRRAQDFYGFNRAVVTNPDLKTVSDMMDQVEPSLSGGGRALHYIIHNGDTAFAPTSVSHSAMLRAVSDRSMQDLSLSSKGILHSKDLNAVLAGNHDLKTFLHDNAEPFNSRDPIVTSKRIPFWS